MGVDQLARRDQELCPLPTNGGDQRTHSGETHAALRESQAGSVGRDDEVAGGDELHRRPEAVPVHRRHHRKGRPANSIVEPLHTLEELVVLERCLPRRVPGEVTSGGERSSRAPDQHASDRLIGLCVAERPEDLIPRPTIAGRDRVEPIRSVQRHLGHSVGLLVADLVEMHRPFAPSGD